jgi:outer membrane protein TolC
MTWTSVRSTLVACFLGAAGAASAQEPVSPQPTVQMTLEQAIDLAKGNSPTFLATLNDLGPATWAVRSARTDLFLPNADLAFYSGWQDGGFERVGGATFEQPSVLLSQYSFGLSYQLNGNTLFMPGQRAAERRAVERRVDDAEVQLRNSVTAAYIEVLRLQAQADQAQRELHRTEEHLRLAQARQDVGAGTRLETMQADVARGQAEVALLQAQNQARVAKLRLVEALGVLIPADRIELTSEFAIYEPQLDVPALIQDALARNPTLVASRADREAANSSLKVAKAAYFPTLSLRASWSGFTREETNVDATITQSLSSAQSNASATVRLCDTFNELYVGSGLPVPPEFSNCSAYAFTPADSVSLVNDIQRENSQFPFSFTNQPLSLSAVFSIPIFSGLDRQLAVEQALTRRNDLDYQVRGYELQITVDVTEAGHNLETAYRTVVLQQENTALAAEELRLARERYQLGAGTFLELLDSQTLAAQAEVDQINAVFAFHQSIAALEAAVGRSLDLRPQPQQP